MFPGPSGRGARLRVLPRTYCVMCTRFLDFIFKFTSTLEVSVKFWQIRSRFESFSLWLCFSCLAMLRCEVQFNSFTVLIGVISFVMDKCSIVLHIGAGSEIVSFPLLNTPLFLNLHHQSAVKEIAPRWPIDCFRDSSSCRCTDELTPILLSSGLSSIVPAGSKTELRRSGLPRNLRSAISVPILVTT